MGPNFASQATQEVPWEEHLTVGKFSGWSGWCSHLPPSLTGITSQTKWEGAWILYQHIWTGGYQPDQWNCAPACLDGGPPVRSTRTMYWLTWMGGYWPDWPELIYQPTWMGGYQPDQLELCTSILGWGATSQINWNLCTGLLGWGATSQINWGAVHLVYWHTYMEVTIHFRWRSCSN